MKWITTMTRTGIKRKHLEVQLNLDRTNSHVKSITACGLLEVRFGDDSTAPKCKNCLRVLRRLMEE